MSDWGKIESNWGQSTVKQDGVSVEGNIIVKQRAIKRLIQNYQLHTLKAKALEDLCVKPKKNEQYRIITEKQFNAFSLIIHVLEEEMIEELYVAIYRINQPTVESIIDFIEVGKIKSATFVISNFFNQTKKPEKWAKLLCEFAKKNENVKHIYTHNHAKVVAMRTDKSNYYVFEGSGNMSDNARIEQYIYDNNEGVYNFHKEWMSNITE